VFYFNLYGTLAFLFALFFSVGLVLIAVVIYYSVANYRKQTKEDGSLDEHAEPGVPLVLKGLYVSVALYILVVTLFFAITGIPI
jgi:ABC-type nickel/cobalt efflux system permease component RcnA